jgi:hypothetical protein
MVELHFRYNFDTFGGSPKLDLSKIPECKIKDYSVGGNKVQLIVLCEDRDIADKLKHYYAIRYELFPKSEKII